MAAPLRMRLLAKDGTAEAPMPMCPQGRSSQVRIQRGRPLPPFPAVARQAPASP